MQSKVTETIRGGALTACAAAVAFGQIAHADAKPNLTDEVGRAEAASIVELSIRQQVLDQLQKTYGHSFENLEMELLEQRSLDPQNMLRFLLSADGLDSCLLLVMLDAESGAVLDVRPEGKLATTDDMVRNKYATVLRNLTTGQTMALRAGDFVPTVGSGGSSSANREGGGSKLGPWPYFPWVAEPRHQSETSADSDSAGSDTPQYTVPLVPAGSSAPVVAAPAPAPVVIASSPAASAPSAPGSGTVSCGGGAACGGGGGAGGSSGGGSASASPAPAAPAAPEEPSTDPSQSSDPTDSEDEDNGDMDKSDSTDPGSEDASPTLPEDSAATPTASSVPARARLFSLPVKMLGATAATYAASEESGVSATAATETPTEWKYGWNSENKCVTLNSKDVTYGGNTVSVTTSGGTCNITRDEETGNYANTVFSLDANPKLIQAVDDTGKVNWNAHVSIKLIANSSDSRADSSLRTDFKGIDTVHLVSNADGSSRSLCMSGASSFLKNEESSLYVNGWHLWLYGTGDMNYAVDVAATLYLGGCNYNIQWATERGVNCDIRAQGLVRFNNTINLIDDASIVGVFSKSESDANSYGVIFTSSSRVNGNGYDLSFAGKGASMSNFVSSPFTMEAGSELSGVKSLIIGRLTSVAPTTLNIQAASGDQAAARIKAGSLRVGQGSTVKVSADGASHMYFSGEESVADYDAGMADYSLLLVKDFIRGSAVINLADKATLSCNTNDLTHNTDETFIGRVTGAFAVDVASDGTLSISGGTAAGKETVGKAGDTCSIMENLKLDIKAGASLVLNDIILGDRHALKGEDAANPGALKLNNVVIGLVPNNYTTQSIANLAEGGSLELKATGGGAHTLTIDDEASILTVYYTGMENLVFEDGSTLVLDFANMELELGEHKYVKVVFDDSVKFDPEKVTITSVSGSLDNTGYYLPTVEGGATNVVYFLAPEPASAVLCLFGLAAGAARRRRKQK